MQKIGEAYLEMNGIDSEYDTEALAWFIASEHVIYARFGPQFGYGMGPQIDAMTILMKSSDILAAKRQAAKIIEIATLAIDDFVKKQKAVQAEVERHRLLQK